MSSQTDALLSKYCVENVALRAEVERLRSQFANGEREIERLRAAYAEARDMVLNDRGPLAEAQMDSAQTNAVLAVLDDAFRLSPPTSAQCSHATVIVVGDQETCQDCGRARRRTTIRTSAALPERIDLKRFQKAPCYICGYNGPNYYQPEVHECAGLYHEQTNEMP